MSSVDDIIVDCYVSLDETWTSDNIVQDPERAVEFARQVNQRLERNEKLPSAKISKRLVTLRKNGKLPRKFR